MIWLMSCRTLASCLLRAGFANARQLVLHPLGVILLAETVIAIVEGAIPPHGVHDRGQFARHGNAGLGVTTALGDFQAPALDAVLAFEPFEQHGRRFIKRAAHIGVTDLADPPLDVD
jgi:hypothetical protein